MKKLHTNTRELVLISVPFYVIKFKNYFLTKIKNDKRFPLLTSAPSYNSVEKIIFM